MNIVKRTNIKIEYETNGRSFRRSRLTSRSASFHRDTRYGIRRVTFFTLTEKIRFAHTKKSSFVNGPGNSFGHFWPKGRISLKGRRLTKQTKRHGISMKRRSLIRMTRNGDTRLFTGFFSETIDIIVREGEEVSRSLSPTINFKWSLYLIRAIYLTKSS